MLIILYYINIIDGHKGKPLQKVPLHLRIIQQRLSPRHPLLRQANIRISPRHPCSSAGHHGTPRRHCLCGRMLGPQLPVRLQVLGSGRRGGGKQGRPEVAFHERTFPLPPQLGHRLQPA